MEENQRLKKEIRRLQEINKQPKLLQQHDLIDNNIGKISDIDVVPSYALLEIEMHKQRLQKHLDAHVHGHMVTTSFGFDDIIGAAESVGSAIGSTAQGVEHAVGSAADSVGSAVNEVANAGVKEIYSGLQEKVKSLIGPCDKDCFKALKDATQKRIGDKKPLNMLYIGHTAFAHFQESGGGLKKMLFGLVYNSLNGLFDWAMPNIRRHLRSQYGSQIRPMFESKTAGIQSVLLKYSSLNIFDVMQNALTDSLRPSIHSACSVGLTLFTITFAIPLPFAMITPHDANRFYRL